MREPETLSELKSEILRQLEDGEDVVIKLTEGDGVHELLASISDGMNGTRCLNAMSQVGLTFIR